MYEYVEYEVIHRSVAISFTWYPCSNMDSSTLQPFWLSLSWTWADSVLLTNDFIKWGTLSDLNIWSNTVTYEIQYYQNQKLYTVSVLHKNSQSPLSNKQTSRSLQIKKTPDLSTRKISKIIRRIKIQFNKFFRTFEKTKTRSEWTTLLIFWTTL